MNDYLILATAVVTATPAALVTGFLLREHKLRRMIRNGYAVTYGITGDPKDLTAQYRDLVVRHELARTVGNRAQVLPFPVRSKRGA